MLCKVLIYHYLFHFPPELGVDAAAGEIMKAHYTRLLSKRLEWIEYTLILVIIPCYKAEKLGEDHGMERRNDHG